MVVVAGELSTPVRCGSGRSSARGSGAGRVTSADAAASSGIATRAPGSPLKEGRGGGPAGGVGVAASVSVAIGTPENPVTFSMFAASDEDADGDDGMGDDGMGDDGMGGDGGMGGAAPAPAQSLPLPVPQPALPQQFTPPPDTGG